MQSFEHITIRVSSSWRLNNSHIEKRFDGFLDCHAQRVRNDGSLICDSAIIYSSFIAPFFVIANPLGVAIQE
jgi:hypothetical protein